MNQPLYPCRHCKLVHLSPLMRDRCEMGCAPAEWSAELPENTVTYAFFAIIGLLTSVGAGLIWGILR